MGNKSDFIMKKRLLELDDVRQKPVSKLEGLHMYKELGAYSYIDAYCNIEYRVNLRRL